MRTFHVTLIISSSFTNQLKQQQVFILCCEYRTKDSVVAVTWPKISINFNNGNENWRRLIRFYSSFILKVKTGSAQENIRVPLLVEMWIGTSPAHFSPSASLTGCQHCQSLSRDSIIKQQAEINEVKRLKLLSRTQHITKYILCFLFLVIKMHSLHLHGGVGLQTWHSV